MKLLACLVFIAAALLEVGGDALIRKGLTASYLPMIFLGFLTVGSYGLLVNLVKWDFSRLLGAYVAVFAVVSVMAGHFFFKEALSLSTWGGLVLIIAGGLLIQLH